MPRYDDGVQFDSTTRPTIILGGTGTEYGDITQKELNDFANVLDYGAVGDGATNDSAAIVLAIASGKPVFFPSGIYLIGTTIAVTSNTTFIGILGASILQSDTGLTSMFTITSTDDIVFDGLTFVGGDAVPTTVVNDTTALALTGMGVNIGINISGGKKVNISNCSFEGFSSCGVKYASSSSNYYYGVKVTNCYFVSNYCGILNLTSGEYSNFTNNTYSHNQIGIYLDSGNNIVDSCHIDGNNVGVVIGDGTNNGHGVLSNSTLNHSVYYGIVCQGLTNGFLINSNQIWYSNIILIDSAGITIAGGYFAQGVMRFQGGLAVGLCKVNNVCFGANATTFRNYNAQSSNVLMTGNYYYTGVDASAINNGDNNIWNTSSINATALGATRILDATNPIFVDSILLYLSAYSGVSANALSVSIGTNSPNYNDILVNTNYSALLNGNFKYVKIPITSGTINNADIYIKVNGVITGTSVLLGTKVTTQYLNLFQ